MRTIGHEELKQMLDRQDDFRLVMALSEWAYQAKHIPGSLHFATSREALQSLNTEDEIVVYCSYENCIASTAFGQLLERHGYTLLDRTAEECMTKNPALVARRELATRALDVMEQKKITSLLVTDDAGRVEGVLHLHDLWKTEMI